MNKRKIFRVLRGAKSLAHGVLVNRHIQPERCSIGELLHATGVPNRELQNKGHWHPPFVALLKKNYDLDKEATLDIVGFNDSAADSRFALDCGFKGHKGVGATRRRNTARACIVIKEIQRM